VAKRAVLEHGAEEVFVGDHDVGRVLRVAHLPKMVEWNSLKDYTNRRVMRKKNLAFPSCKDDQGKGTKSSCHPTKTYNIRGIVNARAHETRTTPFFSFSFTTKDAATAFVSTLLAWRAAADRP
jgi:hypothetical protein